MCRSLEGLNLKIETDPDLRVLNNATDGTAKHQKNQHLEEIFETNLCQLKNSIEEKKKTMAKI